jgi:tetrahydromethanopterin S-methyltransferase subunit G
MMAENVDNIVLEQLRLIREDFKRMDKRFDDLEAKVDELGVRAQSTEGVLFGLGGYIRSIDERVEHIEKKLGIEG